MQRGKPAETVSGEKANEVLGRSYLRFLVEQDPRFEVVFVCESGDDALACVQGSKLHVAFLDVHMPGMDGFQTADRLGDDAPMVVFVTAYSDYAVRAYEFGAFDYVTKPIDPARFESTLNRVADRLIERQAAQSGGAGGVTNQEDDGEPRHGRRLLSGVRQELVYTESEIEVIESHGNYVEVRIHGDVCRVRESLESFCGKLDFPPFARVHRSYVVNLKCVRTIRYGKSGTAELTLSDGYVVPVSRRHRNCVTEALRCAHSSDP
jgi:two-component system LytT family response regulator